MAVDLLSLPQLWMSQGPAAKVMAALRAAGGEGRFVGGCVRDALLGRPIRDIDIATPMKPDAVMEAGIAAGLKPVPTGIEHGTVTLVADHVGIEVTSLRRDVSTDGRRAVVAFTDDWRADAARRDLTINALFADEAGRVYDYFDGLVDLAASRVRFVGDPGQRMDEDFLRVLRFFRFHADYALGGFDPAAISAALARRHELKRLSGERLRQETLKLLTARRGIEIWGDMLNLGIAESYLPLATTLDRLKKVAALEGHLGLDADPIRRLAALAVTGGGGEIAEILRLSNRQRDRLIACVAPRADFAVGDAKAVHRQIYALGNALALDFLLLDWGLAGSEPDWLAAYEIVRGWPRPDLPVTGRDLVKLGFTPGPELGEALKQIEAWWIEGDFTADRQQCLVRAREALKIR
jgi:poly(A) polymerase